MSVARSLGAESGADDREALADIVEALRTLGRPGEARALLDPALPALGTALLVERRLWLLDAATRIDLGDLVGARAALERLQPFLRSPSILRPPIVAQRARLALLQGDLVGLESTLDAGRAEALRFDAQVHRAELSALTGILRLAVGGAASHDGSASVPGIEGDLERLVLAEARVRHGEPVGEMAVCRWAAPYALVVRSRERLVAGDRGGALEAALAAASQAARVGHRPHELSAREAICAALLLLGRRQELDRAARELAELARAVGANRWAPRAGVFAALSGDAVDHAALERIAEAHADPTATRLALHLLGEEPLLDRYEQTMVGVWASARPQVLRSGGPPWGLCRSRRLVWRPDSWHSFARKRVGWALLETLLSGGGEASKEALVIGAWSEHEYHPIRHDARLQVAIRALREELEDDPSAPARLLTTEAGYALGGTVRVLP